jgi:hypothetical protein
MMSIQVCQGQFKNELKIQDDATLVRANRSQMVDEIAAAAAAAAAAGISHGTCHKILMT